MATNCKIREIRSSGNTMSWSGWRDKLWIQCRLDRSFGNDAWFRLFPRAQAEYLEKWGSDHLPIITKFAPEDDNPGRGRFYFDKRMLKREGLEEVIRSSWLGESETNNLSVMDRIKNCRTANCRTAISRWKKTVPLNSGDRIQSLKADWEREISKAFPNKQLMVRIKHDLFQAYMEEEKFWRQKCNENWLKDGDRNTNYFHNCVKGRKAQNRILMLQDDNGLEWFSESSKGEVAVDYFRELFRSTNPHDLESLFEGFPTKVDDQMNRLLTAEITVEEIKKAAFNIKGSSAPGEDGLTGIFYKRFWHIVGPSLTNEIQGFFRSTILPPGWNHTQICLLPKIIKPTNMKDMRPISLCSVHYKIISKILRNRLKQILPSVVSDTQGAFVSGRLITDNILVAHELVHSLRTNDTISENCMAIKTDMSKAFDRVEWCFLETLMETMGFDRVWIRWVMSCVSTVTYSVLLNGRSHGFIKPERGIRQGDSLSPFLFILCAEALVNCLNTSEAAGRLHGIKITQSSPSVHHLLFADDSLLLCQASVSECHEILHCLNLYGAASGQVINHQKSSIIFGSHIENNRKDEVKAALGINNEGGEGSYLGLPESFSGLKRALLQFIHEKLQSRLNGWFAQSLSQGGKEVLLKSIALALPVYAMSCFQLSKDLCKRLTSAMTEFWWSNGPNKKKIPWVAWQKLCRKKEDGGLGFHDISRFNQALLAKQAWRIIERPNSLLSQILKHRYFKSGNFLECGAGRRPSYSWISILHGRELLKRGLVKSIGNGQDTLVWSEKWILGRAPRVPNNLPGIIDFTLKVSDLLYPHSNFWNTPLVRSLFVVQDAEYILKLRVSSSLQDTYFWGFTKHGVYTSQSGYRLLESEPETPHNQATPLSPLEKHMWSSLWKVKTSPKLKHFLWKALAGALAVANRLQTRGINIDPTCLSCRDDTESICHVLFHCHAAREVWDLSGLPLPPSGFSQNSVLLNLYHLQRCSKDQRIELEVRLLFPWLLWHIWKARNKVVFERIRYDPVSIYNKAKDDSEIWLRINSSSPPVMNCDSLAQTEIVAWIKPSPGTLKCNLGASWINSHQNCGVAWLLRDHLGTPLFHSRRSYSKVTSMLETELLSFAWAAESLSSLHFKNVVFECSSELMKSVFLQPHQSPKLRHLLTEIRSFLASFDSWNIISVPVSYNRSTTDIAGSVTNESRYQSYVARAGPSWLLALMEAECAT